jgi:ribosomal protein L16 Arg81 hydroxylase
MTGLADPARILAAVDDGATLVLQGLHRYWEPLRRLVRGLESALGHPGQVNAYFTPPGARGLAVHSDPHDVFVLQAFGTKRWEVHAPEGVWDLELTPGDALYMPEGTPHAATAQDTLSGHLTVGVHTTSWREALQAVVADLLADDAFAAPLPPGWHREPDAFAAELAGRLDDLRTRLDKTDLREQVTRRTERFLTSRPPALAGGLQDRVRLAGLDDDMLVRRRPAALCEARPDGNALVLLLGDRSVRVPAWVGPVVDRLAAGPEVRVGDVPLDPQSRLVLVRRLVREGLLEVVG